jgi:hypothetical protein
MTNAARFWLGVLFGAAFCVLGLSHGQEPTPPPAANVSPTPETPALPEATPEPLITPVPSPPESAAPDLLPESNALPQPRTTPAPNPPNPLDLIPGGPVPQGVIPPGTESSAAQKIKDAIRFREIRTLAERDPYAISLQYYAGRAGTFEERRQYLRLYFHYLGARMRKLEPRLSGMINGYEWGQIGLVTQANIRPTIPLRELDRRKASEKKAREPR